MKIKLTIVIELPNKEFGKEDMENYAGGLISCFEQDVLIESDNERILKWTVKKIES